MTMEYGDDFEEIETPVIPYDSQQLGRIALTWFNTKVMYFTDSRYDHVRYRHEDKAFAFVPTTELQDDLYENNYPTDYRPMVDPTTKSWYNGFVSMIFKEINEILEEE